MKLIVLALIFQSGILPRAETPRDLDIVRHHCSEYAHLAEATEKGLGTIALSNWFRCTYLVPCSHLSNIYKIVF